MDLLLKEPSFCKSMLIGARVALSPVGCTKEREFPGINLHSGERKKTKPHVD